jgi:ribosomal protein S18 acetylase RimI-like enzyme
MGVQISEVGADRLEQYGKIPIRFQVESVLRVELMDGGLGGIRLVADKLDEPYVKDYDAVMGERPVRWTEQFDVSTWGFFLGYDAEVPVGGTVVAYRTEGVNMLEGRDDLAVLWDIRVHPERRREGVGTKLFRHAVAWAEARGCAQLKIETQNVNVPACTFYARQGCHLGAIQRHAYREPQCAHESMLLWYKDL